MTDKIRWGIIGTGSIARQFAEGLSYLPDAELVAVGSRTAEVANAFGDKFGVPHRHVSYEALANDPTVDVVYIGTPHPMHKPNSLLCLEAGKAVLCEKPLTINRAETQAVVDVARAKKLFLMEAMWTRFLPVVVRLREMLAEEAIGQVQMLTADLGFRANYDPHSRFFDLRLGGGALLDLGIYPVSLASMLFGPPTRITSLAHLGDTGVDERFAVILGYQGGQLATLYCSLTADTPSEGIIMGTKGWIRMHTPVFKPPRLTLSQSGQPDEIIELPFVGNGYNHQAEEVMRCLRAGRLESELMPLDESLAIMGTMDQIRAPWGLYYPMEA